MRERTRSDWRGWSRNSSDGPLLGADVRGLGVRRISAATPSPKADVSAWLNEREIVRRAVASRDDLNPQAAGQGGPGTVRSKDRGVSEGSEREAGPLSD